MDIRPINSVPAKWLCSTWIHRDLSFANGGQDASGIDSRSFQRGIAMNGADPKEV